MLLLAELIKRPQKFDCLKDPTLLQIESLNVTPFHIIALLLFFLAILHTLSVHRVHTLARNCELREAPKRLGKPRTRSLAVQCLYFLSEVEIVFVFWAIPLFITIACMYGWRVALDYMNTRDYTESLFVAVILALAATRPIIHAAERAIEWCARWLGGSLSAWWFTLLTVGPILGSLITEVGAMTLSALLLSRQFYEYNPNPRLSYATLALLFVNISVGGILTDFASPAVLVLAHAWQWSTADMFLIFGWKAVCGILASNLLYWTIFRKEFARLDTKKRIMTASRILLSNGQTEPAIPSWITAVHILFIAWLVIISHYPAVFIASFLFFIGFHQATRSHQYPIRLIRPMFVGLFLAGLVIHGGLQGWWVVHLLYNLSALGVMGIAILLTGFNDNTAIAYLATLVPGWDAAITYKYAVFTGVIAGGGLTVIANAPNPAGYAILGRHFQGGIKPLQLLFMALIPTLILYAIFFIFGPVR
ncbi:MAG: hypothetical protein HY861_05275 [Chlamydiia bacterium]|nr:hypothetical protein [Chlamydiia bacterium]